MTYAILNQEHNNYTGHSFLRSGGSIKWVVEILSPMRWMKYDRLLRSVSLCLNFVLYFNVLPENPNETGANVCIYPTNYTHTVQLIVDTLLGDAIRA
jgi:hypothetical protein